MSFQRKEIGYSLKNIPIPNKTGYLKSLIDKTEKFIRRIRWKVFFFEKDEEEETIVSKNNFGFNTENTPPPHKDLTNFENDLFNLIADLQFSTDKAPFQKQLARDIRQIRQSKNVFMLADKTNNIYEVDTTTYNRLLHENITKNYKKANPSTEKKINLEAKHIAENLDIADRVECIAHTNAYITLKDHKENFINNPTCRLINPAKSEIGIISKHYLENINIEIREQTNLNQWRNTAAAIHWFESLSNKESLRLLQLDIVDFYPSISKTLFSKALNFAKNTSSITQNHTNTILHARNSLLFNKEEAWTKTKGLFDVTMGAFDGAEVCELVGLFLLNGLNKEFPNINIGLYRDDALGSYKRMPGPQLERMKKALFKFFKSYGLKITIETDLIQANFLDVTLSLPADTFQPYRKPNNNLLYINTQSNHPPTTFKEIPVMINKRLCAISSNEAVFNKAKPEYEEALRKSGYKCHLNFEKPPANPKPKNRKRDVIWYNPPYNASVTTTIGKQFLALVDKNFPPNHHLRKIINRNTVKLSYSCTKNMKNIIKGHNNAIINKPPTESKTMCNCRDKQNCPLGGQCLKSAIIYKATAKTDTETVTYTGCTETTFKTRYTNHKSSFKLPAKRNTTALAAYHHEQQENNKTTNITWEIIKECQKYKCGSRKCDVCLTEKLSILMNNDAHSLNKRTELSAKCRHSTKWKLKQVK